MSNELHQCPCCKATKCVMDEPCLGCETYAAWSAIPDSKPEEETAYVESVCIESDGCPTELAVLQRFWRENSKPYRWDSFEEYQASEVPDKHYPDVIFNAARERKEG